MSGDGAGRPRWWEIRRAQNLKPVSYRCPLCGEKLPALSEHLLLLPEGRPQGRRHAHTDCVLRARKRGELPTREEFRQASGQTGPGAKRPRWWRRLLGRTRGAP